MANSGVSAGDQLQAQVTYGYDSNPFKLSSPEGIQRGTEFKSLKLKYQGDNGPQGSIKKANLRYRLELHRDIYNPSRDAASNWALKGHLSWLGRFKLGERKANLRLSADLGQEKSTYYSQTQGQIAETGEGDLIGDRFGFDAAAVSAELSYYLSKKTSWSLLSQFSQRNYRQDYANLGLEPLDYNEFRLQPGLRYKADSGLNTRFFVYHRSRHYRGLQNNPQDDRSLVEYSLKGYGLVLSQPLHQRLHATVYLSGYFARDNGQGVRDLDAHKVTTTFKYQLASGADITLMNQAYWRGYLDPQLSPEESEIGTSGRSRRGIMAEIIYSQPLVVDSLRGSIALASQRERNSLDALSYQRSTLVIGLRYEI